jgi:hypothetical protein
VVRGELARGELAISWVTVLRVEVGAIPKRANRLPNTSVVWAGNCKMSNARVVFEIEAEGCMNWQAENERERVAARWRGWEGECASSIMKETKLLSFLSPKKIN